MKEGINERGNVAWRKGLCEFSEHQKSHWVFTIVGGGGKFRRRLSSYGIEWDIE